MARSPHRLLLVAVFPDCPPRSGAFGDQPRAHLARSRWFARRQRPRMARGWHVVIAILERSGEREKRSCRHFLLLERRAPRDPNSPELHGTGEIRVESADRASGYWTTRSETQPEINARTSGIYQRANPEDVNILDGRDDRRRAELIAERLTQWKSSSAA